jgi:filamentous hemagglutinin family protein
MKPLRSLLLGLFLGSVIIVPVQAQITVDGTTNTNLTPIDNGIRIDDGNRAGDNLFHSFSEFSIGNGSEAFFNNANNIVNIFSRVTGGNISNIDGLIRANGTANLFLINPAGIIFGENASLDIGGSFFSSTAESIVFGDNVEFLATDADNPPLLTINMPIGLNFGNNPGEIAVNGSNLQVNNGETLALLGGNVTITGGQIIAPEGRIELGGLTQEGQITFNSQQLGEDFSIDSISFPEGIARADVTLTNSAEVNVQAAGGRVIGVNARNIEISGGRLGTSNLFAGISAESDSPEAQAGDIILNATGDITVSQASRISNNVEESGVGNAGEINITTHNLSLTQGSQINTSTFGQGNAGAITIEALDTISIDGETEAGLPSSIKSKIRPLSGTISLDEETEAEIPSGIFSQVRRGATGNSDKIDITTTNLSLTGGGKVDTSTLGFGDGGAITIKAAGTISADGEGQNAILASGILSLVFDTATGDAGGIDITTTNLSLTQAGRINSSTFGVGDAGAITINAAGTISIDGEDITGFGDGVVTLVGLSSGIFSTVAESGTGNAGGININTNSLSLTNESDISVESLGQGNAGNLLIQANSLSLESAAALFTSTPIGTGGNITLQIAEELTLRDRSTISAQALEDANGGNIDINTNFVVAFPNQNNDIIANAAQGTGGNIDISTNGIFGIEERSSTPINNTNDLDASSEFGLDGTIEINQLDVNPAEGLEELPTSVIDVTRLIAQNLCQQLKGSEFIVTGKGGLAPSPNQVRDGEVIEVDLVEPAPFVEDGEVEGRGSRPFAPKEIKEEIVEAQGWIINDRGILELVAYRTDLNVSPAQPKDDKICNK